MNNSEITKSNSDKIICQKAEEQLYKNCGHRQCTGDLRSYNVTLPSPGNDMAVASDNDICTKIGVDTLENGGSGVDAAISVLLCLGAVQPQSNGIGGGGFMVVHTRDQDKVINFREMAPIFSTEDMFYDNMTSSNIGGLASGVPGPVAGYWKAHKLFGRLNWEELFAPAIKLLEEPISVTKHMEMALSQQNFYLIKDKNAKKIFFSDPENPESYLREGDTFQNRQLQRAYMRIADYGPEAFYHGQFAKNIVKATVNEQYSAHFFLIFHEKQEFRRGNIPHDQFSLAF
jgi:gamma-glutamyltranspeptidase